MLTEEKHDIKYLFIIVNKLSIKGIVEQVSILYVLKQ